MARQYYCDSVGEVGQEVEVGVEEPADRVALSVGYANLGGTCSARNIHLDFWLCGEPAETPGA